MKVHDTYTANWKQMWEASKRVVTIDTEPNARPKVWKKQKPSKPTFSPLIVEPSL